MNFKRIFLLILVVVPMLLLAQDPIDKQKAELENEKNVFFSREIDLTTQQAPQFWAIYNEYRNNITNLRQTEKAINNRTKEGKYSDAQYKDIFEQLMLIEQKKCMLTDKFYKDLDEVLTPRQKVLMYQANKDYKNILIRKIRPDIQKLTPKKN
jgi:Spy/CpxP family protein refolding chaperone